MAKDAVRAGVFIAFALAVSLTSISFFLVSTNFLASHVGARTASLPTVAYYLAAVWALVVPSCVVLMWYESASDRADTDL